MSDYLRYAIYILDALCLLNCAYYFGKMRGFKESGKILLPAINKQSEMINDLLGTIRNDSGEWQLNTELFKQIAEKYTATKH